ncbi:MAG: flagellar assembly protein FliW [Calditrichia bacterium]
MKVVTRQFGELEVSEENIIHFPQGIIGFEDYKKFIIINDEDSEPFRWLISLDKEEFGFPVLNPLLVKKEYLEHFPPKLSKELNSKETLADLFCVVTLKGEDGKMTVNLKGPIIIDYSVKEGKQVILTPEELPVSYAIN